MAAKKPIERLLNRAEFQPGQKYGLEGVFDVLSNLGDPQDKIKVAHVAGTNGKGSTCLFLSSILAASGERVLLSTSPHLNRINERIIIDGIEIGDLKLEGYLAQVYAAEEKSNRDLSFFETVVVLSFLAAKEEKVDWLVLETGLGGRLDATNVVKRPEITLITGIAFDHMDILGDTLEKIAGEKAGILKHGVPAVLGEMKESCLEVFEKRALGLSAEIYLYGRDFELDEKFSSVQNIAEEGFQQRNCALAVQAARLIGIPDKFIARGLEKAFWPGRLERLEFFGNEVLVDCAHNEQGFEELVKHIERENLSEITMLCSFLKGKPWRQFLSSFRERISRAFVFQIDNWRAEEAEAVCDFLSGLGIRTINFGSDYQAGLEEIAKSDSQEKRGGSYLLCGSIYFTGPFRSLMKPGKEKYW